MKMLVSRLSKTKNVMAPFSTLGANDVHLYSVLCLVTFWISFGKFKRFSNFLLLGPFWGSFGFGRVLVEVMQFILMCSLVSSIIFGDPEKWLLSSAYMVIPVRSRRL